MNKNKKIIFFLKQIKCVFLGMKKTWVTIIILVQLSRVVIVPRPLFEEIKKWIFLVFITRACEICFLKSGLIWFKSFLSNRPSFSSIKCEQRHGRFCRRSRPVTALPQRLHRPLCFSLLPVTTTTHV